VLEQLGDDVTQAPAGTMFFAHLMLPHYPYAYDANCRLRPSIRDWLRSFPGRERAGHYPPYLAQVACVHGMLDALFQRMRAAGLFDDAIIIVHGDHGSRLFAAQPKPSWTKDFKATAYIDAFSTLFAIKLPRQPARYDERLLPLDRLLQSFAKSNRIADGMAWAGPPVVHVFDRSHPNRLQRMPDFAQGAPR
jgi:arylsulfatase A-like enzyme